jgi:hypothetical protein
MNSRMPVRRYVFARIVSGPYNADCFEPTRRRQTRGGDLRCNGIARAFWSAVRSPARACSGIATTIFTGTQKSLLFSATLTCALATWVG